MATSRTARIVATAERKVVARCLKWLDITDPQVVVRTGSIHGRASGADDEKPVGTLFSMLQEDMKSLREDTYRSWMNANRKMVDLGPEYLDDPRLIPVSTDELDLLFSGRGSLDTAWRRFSKKYPGSDGYIELSRAGLSGDCQQALIYVGRHTPSFGCNGWELLLERHHSYWVISDGSLHWER